MIGRMKEIGSMKVIVALWSIHTGSTSTTEEIEGNSTLRTTALTFTEIVYFNGLQHIATIHTATSVSLRIDYFQYLI